MAKQDDWFKFSLRVPSELHGRLMEAIGAASLNAEIVRRLEASFTPTATLTPEIAALIERHVQQQVESRLRAIAAELAGASP